MKKYLTVFCGSSTGDNPIYAAHTKKLAAAMVARDLHLVYGAGNVGLMGVLADEVMRLGGEVIGVIPQHLVDREVAHTKITEMIVTATMHERKAIMAEKANAFIAMPGGIGTLEEITEIMTWMQLGLHTKPAAFYNINGFYNQLFDFFKHLIHEKFLKADHIDQLIMEADPEVLLTKMSGYESGYVPKWL